MKVTIKNFELENYINLISSPESFRNNVSVKVPFDMDWALRVNLKTMNERYAVLQEARSDIGKEFIGAGKVDESGERVKEEFLQEFNERMAGVMLQDNEFDFLPIKKKDFKDLSLSMPERDFLMLMADMSEDKEAKED